MFGFFRNRTLDDVINPRKVVRVHGVRFVIRKLNPMDYLAGSKSVRQIFDTFSAPSATAVEMRQAHQKEIDDHFADTFLAAVVEPKLKRKSEDPGEGTPAQHLLTDWDFANQLYAHIIEFTFGKKKIARISSKIGASK